MTSMHVPVYPPHHDLLRHDLLRRPRRGAKLVLNNLGCSTRGRGALRWALRVPRIAALTLLMVAAAAAGTGCETKEAAGEQNKPAPAKVVLGEVSEEGVVEVRRFFGEVRAASNASLSVAEPGRVETVFVEEGDQVEAGQVLVALDDRLARAQLNEALALRERAEAEKEQAQLEVGRFDKMREVQAVSELEAIRKQSEAASLSAQRKNAEAQVAQGSEQLRRHRLVAPFAGTVARVFVDPGDWATPGSPAVELLTSEHLEVELRVPEAMLEVLDRVESVSIMHLGRELEASIDAVVDALDPDTRTALIRVVPKSSAPWLRAGAGVDVALQLRRPGLTIPRDAMVYGVANKRVFRVEQGVANPVPVELLAQAGGLALVSGDLAPGDKLVVKGNERLRPGQAVETEGALVPARQEEASSATGRVPPPGTDAAAPSSETGK